MSEANVSRLVDKLSQMRGAALKLGQFMSIQGEHIWRLFISRQRRVLSCLNSPDTHVLPEQIDRVLRQVQNSAHYMPNWQMEVRHPSEICVHSNPFSFMAPSLSFPASNVHRARRRLEIPLFLLRSYPLRVSFHRPSPPRRISLDIPARRG